MTCPQGHDLELLGRTRQGRCRRCNRESVVRRKQRHMEKVQAYKLRRGCASCGYRSDPRALDLHHRDPAAKFRRLSGRRERVAISQMITYGWVRIEVELAKCDVLCRNCHAVLHDGVTL